MPQRSTSSPSQRPVNRKSLAGLKPSRVPPNDKRSPQGRALRAAREALITHLGGKPSATQLVIIDRAAMLQLHLAVMDEKALATGDFSDNAAKQYLAWSAHLSRLLRALGLEAKAVEAPSLTEYMASRQTRAAA